MLESLRDPGPRHRETLDDRQGRGTGSRIVVMASAACGTEISRPGDGMGMNGKDAVCVHVVCRCPSRVTKQTLNDLWRLQATAAAFLPDAD